MEYSLKEALSLIRYLKTNIHFLREAGREHKGIAYRRRCLKNLKRAFELADQLDSLLCIMLFDEEDMERALKEQQDQDNEDFFTQTKECNKTPSRKRFSKGRIL